MNLRSKRFLYPAAIVVALVLVLSLARGGGVTVTTDVAVRDTLTITVSVEGRTRARDLFTVAAPVSGRLDRVLVEEGDDVQEGDVLGRIYPSAQDPRTLATFRAEVEAAQARTFEVESAVSEARLRASQAEREVERRRPIAELGAISEEAMEQAELAAVVADERLQATEAALDAARASLRSARARLLGSASGDGSTALPLRAPVSGRVLNIPDESERVVMAGTPLLELANTGGLEVVLDVLSEDAVRIASGQVLRVTGWGGEGVLTGTVRIVTLAGYTKVSALGVEEQRVDVLADLDSVPTTLGTGYRISGQIVLSRGDDVLTVPTSAVFRAADGWRLFALSDGRAALRDIEIGRRNEAAAEVLSGLQAGEAVILFPSEEIQDGVRVTPLEPG